MVFIVKNDTELELPWIRWQKAVFVFFCQFFYSFQSSFCQIVQLFSWFVPVFLSSKQYRLKVKRLKRIVCIVNKWSKRNWTIHHSSKCTLDVMQSSPHAVYSNDTWDYEMPFSLFTSNSIYLAKIPNIRFGNAFGIIQ